MAAANQENHERAAATSCSPHEPTSVVSSRTAASYNGNHNRTQEEALRFMQEQLSSMAPPPERAAVAATASSNSFPTADFIDKTLLNSTGSVTSKFWDELAFPSSSSSAAAAATNRMMNTNAGDPNRLSDQELLERFPSVGSLGPVLGWPLSRNISSASNHSNDLQQLALRSSESNLFSSAAWAPQMLSQHTDDNVVYRPEILFRTTSLGDADASTTTKPTATLTATSAVPPLDLEPPVEVKAAAAVPVPPPPMPKQKPLKKRRRSSHGSNLDYIPDAITDHDVLMGRGGRTNHHKGNEYYLNLKTAMQQRYLAAAKEDKTAISQELVDAIHERGGRFLKLEDHSNRWYVVSSRVARKKASQTLRELNTPEARAAKRAKYSKDNQHQNQPSDPSSHYESATEV